MQAKRIAVSVCAVARVALAAGDVHGTKNQKWPVVVMTSTLHKEESPVCDVRES
jgi:hypothetical protein